METANIVCRVEANPPQVSFRWTFNNSAEAKQVEERFIRTNGSRSILTFTPTRTLEYGTLMCWSKNDVGEQSEPCVFHIIAAGKPEAVQNCSVTNESTDSFQVNYTVKSRFSEWPLSFNQFRLWSRLLEFWHLTLNPDITVKRTYKCTLRYIHFWGPFYGHSILCLLA